MMDSLDNEFEINELDEFIYKGFFDSSDSDDEVANIMLMMSIQEKMEKQVEYVLNFKCSIKGPDSCSSG